MQEPLFFFISVENKVTAWTLWHQKRGRNLSKRLHMPICFFKSKVHPLQGPFIPFFPLFTDWKEGENYKNVGECWYFFSFYFSFKSQRQVIIVNNAECKRLNSLGQLWIGVYAYHQYWHIFFKQLKKIKNMINNISVQHLKFIWPSD